MDWGILSKKKDKQEEFLYYLKEWNKVHNLTGIKDFSFGGVIISKIVL